MQSPKWMWILILFVIGCQEKAPDIGSAIDMDPRSVLKGQEIFNLHCKVCHNFKNRGIGPNLAGITRLVRTEWLKRFIQNSDKMIAGGDYRADSLYMEYKTPMPSFIHLSEPDIDAVISYLHTYAEKREETQDTNSLINPIPSRAEASNINLSLELITTIPPSSSNTPLARINKMACVSPLSRLFINDLRGQLYELVQGTVSLYLDLNQAIKNFITLPGLGTGFGSFAFHPDFSNNGVFYTSHTEPGGTQTADFAYHDTIPVTLQWVVTEWKTTHPHLQTFKGTKREILRINFVSGIHGMQELAFNPNSKVGDKDYGNLYIGIGEGGCVLEGYPWITIHQGQGIWGSIIRINPAGSNSKNRNYGIPANNPFAEDTDKCREIWAWGFRNPNRITWDEMNRLLATDIGQNHIEEINLVKPGKFYGWPFREGTFSLNPYGDITKIYSEAGSSNPNWQDPLIQYDHDEGVAVSGGYATRIIGGSLNYIFGDIPTGNLFFYNLQDTVPERIYKWNTVYDGKKIKLKDLTRTNRVDLRFGKDCDGNLCLFTKADGKVYRIRSME